MTSPFPGMDPYLEAHWGDVHTSLATYTRDQLQKQLPRELRARIEEQVLVEDEDEEDSPVARWKPDARVVERNPDNHPGAKKESSVALAEPLIVEWIVDPLVQRSVRIIDSTDNSRLVTAIEFLSPANKIGRKGRDAYRRKQRDYLDGGVSLVEIDLGRKGDYVLAAPKKQIPSDLLEPYRICVSRGWQPGHAEFYRIPLRLPLPTIRIPLRERDADVTLELQAIIMAAYESGGYDDIDYTQDPDPPLSPDDAAWADLVLREKGKRQ
jgi:hypothetical protein